MDITVSTSELLSVAQAARELGRARITIYKWIERDKIVGVWLGGRLFIPKSEVDRLKRGIDGKEPPIL